MNFSSILRIFFPPVCVICDRYADYFCADCQDKIDFLYFQPRLPPIENLIEDIKILGFFVPPLSTVIKALKYQSLHQIGPVLGDLLYKHLQFPTKIDYVTAVPLHAKRLRWRGYNQAELIAQQLALNLKIPYRNFLARQRHTQNLASTASDQERLQLMTEAFTVPIRKQTLVSNKNILLVDDIVTTGATLAACATQLKKFGAKKIFAVTLAHEG
ncbi:MAG: ComF family protein [Candidatus Paceibacterota bacterium]